MKSFKHFGAFVLHFSLLVLSSETKSIGEASTLKQDFDPHTLSPSNSVPVAKLLDIIDANMETGRATETRSLSRPKRFFFGSFGQQYYGHQQNHYGYRQPQYGHRQKHRNRQHHEYCPTHLFWPRCSNIPTYNNAFFYYPWATSSLFTINTINSAAAMSKG